MMDMRWLTDRLGVIFDPESWFYVYPVCHTWDAELNQLLDQHTPEPSRPFPSPYWVMLGDVKIWVGNFPFGYGSPEMSGSFRPKKILPRRKTRLRLYRAISDVCHTWPDPL